MNCSRTGLIRSQGKRVAYILQVTDDPLVDPLSLDSLKLFLYHRVIPDLLEFYMRRHIKVKDKYITFYL